MNRRQQHPRPLGPGPGLVLPPGRVRSSNLADSAHRGPGPARGPPAVLGSESRRTEHQTWRGFRLQVSESVITDDRMDSDNKLKDCRSGPAGPVAQARLELDWVKPLLNSESCPAARKPKA